MSNLLGYSWLVDHYDLRIVQPLRHTSEIGASRQTRVKDGFVCQFYPSSYRPEATFAGHMMFALKYEGVNPEVLARLFAAIPEDVVSAWIKTEPSGQYARRTGFLWEWFTGRELLGVPPVTTGNYVDAVDENRQLTALIKPNNPRWRVRDNMPGTRSFCPLVVLTDCIQSASTFDCAAELDALNVEFGVDVLSRSAVWLTIKESRSSFRIEHEDKKADDISRFAAVMEQRCGEEGGFLSAAQLSALQHDIIGQRTTLTHFGIRQSPVFVGSHVRYENVIHYVAPHWDDVPLMLDGLEQFLLRTAGRSPLVRAATASFGFVYIHPLADGNGRVHRFLINDILRRDGAVPAPYILPVSAVITHSPVDRATYDAVLDVFSRPFMRCFSKDCRFGLRQAYPDGIDSDFHFSAYDEARPAWRYPDLTAHVEYMTGLIERTIRQEMTNEARWLRDWGRARAAVKTVIDGPDTDIDRIIRSLQENHWMVSNALKKQFPVLGDAVVAEAIVLAAKTAFDDSGSQGPR